MFGGESNEMKVYYLLLCVYCVTSSDVDDDDDDIIRKVRTEDSKRRTVIEQLSKDLPGDRTELLDGYDLVARRVTIDVKQFENYGHMSIISFLIQRDVSVARLTFQSKEVQINNIGSCEVKDVIIDIKRASYPAVNPDNYSFPMDFISTELREPVYTAVIRSDGIHKHFTIENPKPGNWYGMVYVKWEDRKKNPIKQKGLGPDCCTVLYTDLQVKQEHNIEVIDCYAGLSIDYADLPADFKCITVDSIEPIYFTITITNTTTDSKIVLFRLQALTFPSEDEYLISCAFDPRLSNVQTLTFRPNPAEWHYVHLNYLTNSSKYDDCALNYRSDLEEYDKNHTVLELMRDDKGRFFTFEYGTPTTDIREAASFIDITTEDIKTVRFRINEVVDIGGNLIIKAAILMSLEYYMSYSLTEINTFFKIVACINLGYASIPMENGHCLFNDKIKPAVFVLKSTSTLDYSTSVIPFPDSGTWYITFRLFYEDSLVCLCRTRMSHDRRKFEETGDKGENTSRTSSFSKDGKNNKKATVVLLSIASTSCIYDDCDHGECKIQTTDMVMSFCSCHIGYGGWDCSDDSRLDSLLLLYTAIFLLTLSNLFFLISIYVAVIRLYYTEAVMYACTMVFSTIYHSCDAPEVVSRCIVKKQILQFSDFFCGLLCFWVTLIAMTIIPDTLRPPLQLFGAICIAVLTTWDKHSIVTFILPFIVGTAIVFLSWFWDRIKNSHCRYPKSYYRLHFPSGLVLVILGLLCYALLQTENNYKTVHSFWHGLIALSVVFFLPDVRREEHPHPFLPSPNFCRLGFFKIFKKQPIAPDTENNLRAD